MGLVLRIFRTVEQAIKLLTIVLSIYELPWENPMAMLEMLIRAQLVSVLDVQVLCHVEPYSHVTVTILLLGMDTYDCIRLIQFQHLLQYSNTFTFVSVYPSTSEYIFQTALLFLIENDISNALALFLPGSLATWHRATVLQPQHCPCLY